MGGKTTCKDNGGAKEDRRVLKRKGRQQEPEFRILSARTVEDMQHRVAQQ